MTPADHRARLFEFVRSISPGVEIRDDRDELELDSLELLQVVAYLEKTYAVRLDDYDIDPDDLRSTRGLTSLLERFR